VAVEQKFHNTSNELQHNLLLFRWLSIWLLLVVVVLLLVVVVRVGSVSVHCL
jgi:CHASE3 domain sensor protein